MSQPRFCWLLALALAASSACAVQAAQLLSSTDFIIAIDVDPPISGSSYPGAEGPNLALDLDPTSKYLNFGKLDTGLIVSPFTKATILQSIQFTSANDAAERDPMSWVLFGTNDFVISEDNSLGNAESWTQIAAGDTGLPVERQTAGPVIPFANSTVYDSYKIVFPTVRDANAANSMQIADIGLYQTNDGSGSSIAVGDSLDFVIAIQTTPQFQSSFPANESPERAIDSGNQSSSNYPEGEAPSNTIDQTLAKYLNFGEANSGFIVTPAGGPAQVRSFQLTTANDAEERDPAAWELYGTNDTIVSGDNSFGTAENWTLIDSGSLALPPERDTLGPVIQVNNNATFASYKMLFPSVKDEVLANSMQIAEAAFYTSTDGTGLNVVAPGDAILAVDLDPLAAVTTKYLNFGEENSGFIVTPGGGQSIVNQFQISTANDAIERDPTSWELYGTNDAITSEQNSQGSAENWVLIASGSIELPEDRQVAGPLVSFANSTAYTSYRMIFPTVRDATTANSMQISDVQFFGDFLAPQENADFNEDGVVDGRDLLILQRGFGLTGQTTAANGDANGDGSVNDADFAIWSAQFGSAPAAAAVEGVPEPTAACLAAAALAAACARRRRSC